MEIAAWCAWATAQMMFSGPKAASPPMNTFGCVVRNVTGSTTGMSHFPNSMPMSRSIQGNAFSWPMATRTSSHSKTRSSPVGISRRRPFSSSSRRTWSKRTPVRRPPSCRNSFGTRKLWMGMSSIIASSISHSDAFISSKPLRTTTSTCSPPRRRAVRQQSIAVLPPPSTTTRRPMRSVCSNATLESQSMPMLMWSAASRRPGMSSSRPRGAPVPMKIAS